MKKKKLYFPEWDDEYCCSLSELKGIAKESGIREFDATEAVPTDNSEHDFLIWCGNCDDYVEKNECNASDCEGFEPDKTGKICQHRKRCLVPGKNIIHIKIPMKDNVKE